MDILRGVHAPAGRLVTTQYPADYVTRFSKDDMTPRPNPSDSNPGQTYKWYTGYPVFPFRARIFYTSFNVQSTSSYPSA